MPPNPVIGNVSEMSCVLATGNLPEILPYCLDDREKVRTPGKNDSN